jgi:hypothetical protein
MTSSDSQKPIPFLVLPAELRCLVYVHINIPPKSHTLTCSNAGFIGHGVEWPVLLHPSTSESSITFLRPILSTTILSTCRLFNSEATSIFARKLDALNAQPIRFLVDWASACALGGALSPLSACLGPMCCLSGWNKSSDQRPSLAAQAFVSKCRDFSWQRDITGLIVWTTS